MQANLVPIVVEKTGRGERSYDIFSRRLKDRIIFIGPSIDDYSSSLIIAQILFLMSDNKNQDINIYINSPGGSVTAGMAIYDPMQFVPCDIATYCLGQASSMGAVLLAELPRHDSPTLGRSRRHRFRHPHPVRRAQTLQEQPERYPGQAHRPET